MATFDQTVNKNINDYIIEHNYSLSKLAKASGINYPRLFNILKKNNSIKVGDYVAICKAVKEPFEFFLPK